MQQHFDLQAAARAEMIHDGFHPDFPEGVTSQLSAIRTANLATGTLQDLRTLPWSSIDNDTSRDLDQIEWAEPVADGIRILIGIADVESAVGMDTPIDRHAASETTSVYTAVKVFPMLPEELSTDLTSLTPNQDRRAIVIEYVVSPEGKIARYSIYPALVRNRAQLTYSGAGKWLEDDSIPPEWHAQLKLQDEAATALRGERHRLGALNFDRVEAQAVVTNGQVQGITAAAKNHATALIEDFMVAANEVMAMTLKAKGVSSIRRVVKQPERWPRIVELAARYGDTLPDQPDSRALNDFLERRKTADPLHYADVSLAVVKLMGPGQYVMSKPGDENQGHFGLAAQDYTHSTAPNRRYADLVTQRLVKAALAGKPAPYTDLALEDIANNCTAREDAARKVERAMGKRVAAVAFQNRVGQTFNAIVTGANQKGTFVRVIDPPVEGRLMRGEQGLDVGDQLQVTLLSTDPERGFIDFGRR